MKLKLIKAFSNREDADEYYMQYDNWLEGKKAYMEYQKNVKMWIVKLYE